MNSYQRLCGSRWFQILLTVLVTTVVTSFFRPSSTELIPLESRQRNILSQRQHKNLLPQALCHNAPMPRVAVCVVGAIRTFTQPAVHVSIRDNLLDKFGGDQVIFALLSAADAEKKSFTQVQTIDTNTEVLMPNIPGICACLLLLYPHASFIYIERRVPHSTKVPGSRRNRNDKS